MAFHDNNITTIGGTPLVRLNRLPEDGWAEVLVKLESFNPGGSVKDRICMAMIEDAEKKGTLKPGMTVIEPTSGNTGIGLALVCAIKGYPLVLAMPESMSIERRKLLAAYGAQLVLTPAGKGMPGAIEKAGELLAKADNIFMPGQFDNPANPGIHRRTTAVEIWDATGGKIDAFVAGVGTGGTITGVGEVLREKLEDRVKIVAVEPAASPVLSGGKPGPHKIQGIGAGFVPKVLNTDILDEIITIEDNEAIEMQAELAQREGIFTGISGGANVLAALKIAAKLGSGKRVVTVAPDTGERYLSMQA
ncbi:MAG: cysteine synthase A [Planctomycetota bacterium]